MNKKDLEKHLGDVLAAFAAGGPPAVDDIFPPDVEDDLVESLATAETPSGDLVIIHEGKRYRFALVEYDGPASPTAN